MGLDGVMDQFVVLLRGINVGGVKVPMAELAEVLREAGFEQVRTVLATGNAILDAAADGEEVRERAEAALEKHFGRRLQCLAYPAQQFLDIAAEFPLPIPDAEHHRYVTFTASQAAAAALLGDLPQGPEPRLIRGPVLYWLTPRGTSTTGQLAAALQRLAARHLLTSRNLNTVQKVAQLLRQAPPAA